MNTNSGSGSGSGSGSDTKCEKCPFRNQKKVPSSGDIRKAKYILVGEAPGRNEVVSSKPFVGETGALLKAFFDRVDLELHGEDFYLMNALSCQVRRKSGIPQALACCRQRVINEILAADPGKTTLVVMGKVARDTLFPRETGGILGSRGWHKLGRFNVYIMAHPSYYLYNPDEAPMLAKDVNRIKRGRLPQIGPFYLAHGIPLVGKYGGYVWVSQEDLLFASLTSWHGRPNKSYVEGDNDEWLHVEIASRMGLDVSNRGRTTGSTQVDHIDRDRLNCCRENLRVLDLEDSRLSRSPKTGTGNRFKGVCYTPQLNQTNPWTARADQTHLGYYGTEEEAAQAYDDHARQIYAGRPYYLNFPRDDERSYVGRILDTHGKLQWLIDKMSSVPLESRDLVSFDLETDQVDFQRDRVLCMSISTAIGRAFIIPDSLLYRDRHTFFSGDWTKKKSTAFYSAFQYETGSYLKPDGTTARLLNEMFELPGYRWCGQNAKFDLRFLQAQLGVTSARCDFDTIIAHYALDERGRGHGLKLLADDYFDVGDYEGDLYNYITKKSARYSMIPRSVLYKYNAMDTECTLRLAWELEKELKVEGLYEKPFMSVLMRAVPMLLSAEIAGLYVDWEEVDRIEFDELLPEINRLTRELREMSGYPDLNPLSSQKINNILYDNFEMPIVTARTRAGGHHVTGRSSQKAIMDAWDKMNQLGELHVSEAAWRFVETLKEFRHLRKLLGSYIRKWQNYRGIDDRVHTSFLLRGTVTGRLASRDPPLQTIPSKITDRWGPLVANVHKSQPGWSLMYADYSQAELMVAAGLSRDEFMMNTFQQEGADYHSEVARAAFGENFTRDERQMCKKLTFGWLYGGNAKEIALEALQFDGPVAERFAHEWDNLFKGVVAWRAEQAEKMMKQGYVESMFGRRRRQMLLTRTNIGKAKRIAVNAPIQSAVSDFNLLAAVALYDRFKDTDYARVVLLIHDSLIMEVRDDKVEEVEKIMQDTMLEIPRQYLPDIPFQAEVKVSKQLGDLT